jgi:6-pyruvoyltetrahydropterin/6-carboxytetrahydropterin synthase
MEIRKEFSFKGTHIVRNCSSNRCKFSIHGHLYIVEVFINSTSLESSCDEDLLDDGEMIYDFGLMKATLKGFIKLFDNTYALWNKESDEFKANIKEINSRWIELPCSPSAESLAILIHAAASKIINNTVTANNEKTLSVSKVKVHETRTGYAETSFLIKTPGFKYDLGKIKMSNELRCSLSEQFKNIIFKNTGELFRNETPVQQT